LTLLFNLVQLALMVHPDKNKQPGAEKAFQTVKRAFDALLSGVDPDAPDTCKVLELVLFQRMNTL
jgi:hypothetical protein